MRYYKQITASGNVVKIIKIYAKGNSIELNCLGYTTTFEMHFDRVLETGQKFVPITMYQYEALYVKMEVPRPIKFEYEKTDSNHLQRCSP